MDQLFCTNCGAPARETPFCTVCGQPAPTRPVVASTPPPPPPPVPSGPTAKVLIAVACVLALVAIGGVAVALVAKHSGSGGDQRTVRSAVAAAAIDAGTSILSRPGRSWKLAPQDVVRGGDYFEQVGEPTQSYQNEVSLGWATTTVADAWSENGYQLTGIDTSTGKVAWKIPSAHAWMCSGDARPAALLCWTGPRFDVIDLDTGNIIATASSRVGRISAVTYADGRVFLVGHARGQHGVSVSQGTLRDPDAGWQQRYEQPAGGAGGEGGGIFAAVHGDQLSLLRGTDAWLVAASTGALKGTAPLVTGFADGDFVNSSQETGRTVVTDTDGNTLLDEPDLDWGVDHGRMGIGDALLDLSTGRQLWARPDLPMSDAASLTWAHDGRQVFYESFIDSSDSTLSALDPTSGRTLWTAHHLDYPQTSTRDATISFRDVEDPDSLQDHFTVVDRGSGEVAWSGSLYERQGDDEDYAVGTSVTLTGNAVIAASSAQIHGYTDFGPAPGTTSSSASPGTRYVTACGSAPVFTPVRSVAANGGITVTFTVHATCPSGQWLSSDGQRVTMTCMCTGGSSSGAGGDTPATYLDGNFDFSESPYWVPGSGASPVTMQLVFPFNATYATADQISQAITDRTVLVKCTRQPGATDADVPSSTAYGTDPGFPATASGPGDTSSGAGSASPSTGTGGPDAEADALAALKRIAKQDAPYVQSHLDERWVPQLSSKLKGTADDGIVYDYQDILAEHLRLRARYPRTRLVFSTDWKSFTGHGFWVTVVADPTSGWRAPLRWCRSHGYGNGHCYAKKLSHVSAPGKDTKHMADLDR